MLSITPERLRAVRRWLLQSAFGLLVFGVALYFCFPYDRAKDLAIAWAANQGYDVTIGSAGSGLRVRRQLQRHPRAQPADRHRQADPVLARFGARARVAVRRCSARRRRWAIAAVGAGRRSRRSTSSIRRRGRCTSASRRSRSISGSCRACARRSTCRSPARSRCRWTCRRRPAATRDADGTLSFKCKSCVLGDGKTPLKVEGNPLLSGGLTLPKVRLGDLVGRVVDRKGRRQAAGGRGEVA